MRIGIITPGFSADEQDWCIPALLDLVRELATTDEVEVFALRYPHHRGAYQVYRARAQSFGGAEVEGMRRAPLLGRALASILARARAGRFDVLHAMWADEPGLLAVVAGRLLDVPSVVSVMGGELVGFPELGYGGQISRAGRWLTKAALARASRATVGSAYLRRLAKPYVRSDRLATMPLGVDTSLFRPEAQRANAHLLGDGRRNVLHVASLVPIKDQATLLNAVSRAVPAIPDMHLHIVGAGPLQAGLERFAEALGIRRQITFHGAVRREFLPAYYRAADLCVLSSRHESQSLVALEAAACGRVTVGTAVGLLPELAPPNVLAPVGEADALAHGLMLMLQNPEERAQAEASSLAKVHAEYSLEARVRSLRSFYRAMVSG